MKKQWFVYKYTFPNGKVYIGKTHTKGNRFGVTSGYKVQLVYRAMKKYPEYQKEILEYYNNEQDAYAAEIKYIAQYNSTNPQYGYNVTEGGDGASAKLLFKKVKQYDLCGNLIREWPSIIDAAESLGISDCGISQNCYPDKYPEVKTVGGYQWELIDSPRNVPNLGADYKQKHTFKQYSLNGTLLKEYNTAAELRAAGYSSTSVYRVCHGQRSVYKGYRWTFGSEKLLTSLPISGRRILQYSLQGEYIKTWEKIQDAAEQNNLTSSSISHVCRGDRQQAGGYQWRYEDQPLPVHILTNVRNGNKNAKRERT